MNYQFKQYNERGGGGLTQRNFQNFYSKSKLDGYENVTSNSEIILDTVSQENTAI